VVAYAPFGTIDAKVTTTELASEHRLLARCGSACGRPFAASDYLGKNPQFSMLEPYLFDRPTQVWAELYSFDDMRDA
jgi:hypothetical protein